MIPKRKIFKKNKRPDSIVLPVILTVLFLTISGFLVVSNFRIFKKRTELQSQIQSLQAQINALEEEKKQLEAGISEGESETFWEEQAREKLGLKKPGEEVTVVLPPEKTVEEQAAENKNFWQRILEKLGF